MASFWVSVTTSQGTTFYRRNNEQEAKALYDKLALTRRANGFRVIAIKPPVRIG